MEITYLTKIDLDVVQVFSKPDVLPVGPTEVFNIVRYQSFPTVETADVGANQMFRTPGLMYPNTNTQDESDFVECCLEAYDYKDSVLVVWESEAARDACIVTLQTLIKKNRPRFSKIFVSRDPISAVLHLYSCLGSVGIDFPEYPTAITPSIFISGELPASQRSTFDDLGITNVVNVTDDVKNFFEKEGRICYHNIRIEDHPSVNILPYLSNSTDFIRDALARGGKVLVHCAHGRSRSVSMVLAYLIRDQKVTLDEAIDTVKAQRGEARPNRGFLHALEQWEQMCVRQRSHIV